MIKYCCWGMVFVGPRCAVVRARGNVFEDEPRDSDYDNIRGACGRGVTLKEPAHIDSAFKAQYYQ